MARGSRHKSTRRGSKDARDSSDSEKGSSLLRDRKGRENGSEKRRFDSKDAKEFYSSENLEKEERGFSKRGKERYDEGITERWNGGSDDDRADRSKKSKASADSKSKRRDESFGLQCDGEELKKSTAKSEGKHRDSSRKEGRNGGGVERERKGREGRSDNAVASDEHRLENNTENVVQSPGVDDHLEIRFRRRAGSFDGDKHRDDVGYIENRKSSSKNDSVKDGRRRSEKHKDERNKEKYWEDADKDREQRDKQLLNDHRSNLRDEKDAIDKKHKRNGLQDSDPNREFSKSRACEGNVDAISEKNHDRDRYREQESRHGRDRDRDRGRGRDRDHDQDGSQNRSRSHARDRHNDYECDFDRDGLHLEDESTKYVSSRGRKRSPIDHDDSIDPRSKSSKNSYHSNERKRSLSNDKVESVADRSRSRSRSRHADGSLSSHKQKSSPSSTRVCIDEYRHPDQKDLRDGYPKREERSKSISARDQSVFSGGQERGSKRTYVEKSNEADGRNAADLLHERSLNSKNIDIVESGRRGSGSIDTKDLSSNKDRQSRDLPGEKPLVDESSQAESSFYHKTSQSNPSSFHSYPAFRAGVDISFDGPAEDDVRFASNSRFRRSGDPNLGRMHVNTWRGIPNWTAPLPNGFIPFQHGPPHGGFPSIMPQFAAPPLFGIRSPLDINHSGIPYRVPDAERFSSHLHPLGWQNMFEGSSPSHLHGWDGNNGVVRDESHLYSAADREENKQTLNGRGWESRADLWKKPSGFVKRELPPHPPKGDQAVQDPLDDVSSREVCDESSDCVFAKTAEMSPIIPSSAKESPNTPELLSETPAPSKPSMDDNFKLSCVYLSKLEISAELASPDLYNQCRRLMDIEHCAAAEEETALCIIPEGGVRAAMPSLNITHQPIQNSVFQRAMDLYKKQRMERKKMEIVSRGQMEGALVSLGGRLGEQCSNLNNEEVMVPVSSSSVEVTNTPMSTVDDMEVETAATLEKSVEDLDSNVSQEVKHLEDLEKPLPVLNLTEMDVMAPEQQMNVGAERDTIIQSDGVLAATDNNIKEIANGDDCTQSGNENPCFDKAVSTPLSFSDEACEGLMPDSIGSESLILSRIHHSPESTR